MNLMQTILTVRTPGAGLHEFTSDVAHFVRESGAQQGLLTLFVQHTSCSLLVQENADPDVRRDLETVFARLAPDGDPAYRHDLEGDDDMAAHARSVLSGASLTIPVGDGRLLLGCWQGVFLWEHRTASHVRRVVVTVMG